MAAPLRHGASRALVLSGCTGIGKSQMAMALAQRLDGEIISADSVAVYRELDIGSDKPSRLWRSQVPHHLIDIANPKEALENPYTAGQFARDARLLIHDICQRGRVPIVTGGTGFYLGMLLRGHDEITKTEPATIDLLNAVYANTNNWKQCLQHIVERLSPNDSHRSQEMLRYLDNVQYGSRKRLKRAVQRLRTLSSSQAVPEYSGRRLSPLGDSRGDRDGDVQGQGQSVDDGKGNGRVNEAVGGDGDGDGDGDSDGDGDNINFRCLFLNAERGALFRRLDLRCEEICQRGLLDEVLYLTRHGLLPAGSAPATSIGYRQAIEYLYGSQGIVKQGFNLAQFRVFMDQYQAAMRQFARKQITWFRKDPAFHFVMNDASTSAFNEVLDLWGLNDDEYATLRDTETYRQEQIRRRTLSPDEVASQRLYLPTRRIFKDNLSTDAILNLMAQTPQVRSDARYGQ